MQLGTACSYAYSQVYLYLSVVEQLCDDRNDVPIVTTIQYSATCFIASLSTASRKEPSLVINIPSQLMQDLISSNTDWIAVTEAVKED